MPLHSSPRDRYRSFSRPGVRRMKHRAHAIAGLLVLVACDADKRAGDVPPDATEVSEDIVAECRPATSPTCTFESKPCDCGVAFLLNHPGISGDTPRAKCRAVCAGEAPLIGENGLNGTWCDAACNACITVAEMTCEACCLLSDLKPVGDLCDQIDGPAPDLPDQIPCDGFVSPDTASDDQCCCLCPDGSPLRRAGTDSCSDQTLPDVQCEGHCLESCPEWQLPTCTSIERPAFSVCIAPADDPDFAYRGEPVLLAGTIESVGDGPAVGGCRDRPFAIEIGTRWGATESYWFSVRDSRSTLWLAEVSIAGAPRPKVGDPVLLEAWLDYMEWNPTRAKFFLSDVNGAPLVWVARAAAADELPAPVGFRFWSWPRSCLELTSCGNWAGYDLGSVTTGSHTNVPYGGVVDLGDFVFMHGGNDMQVNDTTNCPDWFVANALMAAVWKTQTTATE